MSLTALAPARGVLAVRLAAGVTLRAEDFGAVAYVGDRDDFFALDPAYASVVRRAVAGTGAGSAAGPGATVDGADADRARLLASLGVCETTPATPERPHLGRSLVGDFAALPRLSRPLVVNCFSTAHCPLSCGYCHADDLMTPFRAVEGRAGLAGVARTAGLVPAMVGVVTGGDPIVVPDRAIWLMERLAARKRVVLDTSGVGDIRPLLPALRRHRAHVRVSLDFADARLNDRVRPANPRYLPRGTSGFARAHVTLRRLRDAGVPSSVQTVVGRHNQHLDHLRALRDHLVAAGVRHWVLHVAIPAGKAGRQPALLPDADALDRLRALVRECVDGGTPIDVRVTGTHRSPNAVLLVDTAGRLCVERRDGTGKEVIWRPDEAADPHEVVAALPPPCRPGGARQPLSQRHPGGAAAAGGLADGLARVGADVPRGRLQHLVEFLLGARVADHLGRSPARRSAPTPRAARPVRTCRGWRRRTARPPPPRRAAGRPRRWPVARRPAMTQSARSPGVLAPATYAVSSLPSHSCTSATQASRYCASSPSTAVCRVNLPSPVVTPASLTRHGPAGTAEGADSAIGRASPVAAEVQVGHAPRDRRRGARGRRVTAASAAAHESIRYPPILGSGDPVR